MATQTEPRLPLSRERILQAALELVDEGGIESLTMRKLGQVLGFEAMSLYNHVANKDDVLDGILDLVLAESEPPSPTGDWDAAITSERDLRTRRPPPAPVVVHVADVARTRPPRKDALHGLAPRTAARSRVLGRDDVHRLPRARRTHLRLLALGDESQLHGGRGVEARGEVRGDRSPPMRTRTSTNTPSSTSAKAPTAR